MRVCRGVVAVLIVGGLAACGPGEAPAMPDVTGKKLDVAKSDIKRAGIDEKVEVFGGGTFGVLMESNWEVCEQIPAAGKPLTAAPRLTVHRDCDAVDDKATGQPRTTTAAPAPTGTEAPPATPTPEPILTVKNNRELATLLSSPQDDELAAAFAAKYADRMIEFDANVGAMAHHDDKQTRYDMLIIAGDFDENRTIGPMFRFVDISPVLDLHPTAKNPPGTIGVGDNLHVVARVGEFNETAGTWELVPVHVDHR